MGAPIPSTAGAPSSSTEGGAVPAFILSLVGLFFFGLILGPISIALAAGANSRLRKRGLPGSGLATAAVVIGSLSTALWLLVMVAVAVPAFVKYSRRTEAEKKAVLEQNAARKAALERLEAPPRIDAPPVPARSLPSAPPSLAPHGVGSSPPKEANPKAALPPAPRKLIDQVALELKAASWQESPLLNIREELETALKDLKVHLTDQEHADASLVVDYEEKKGRLYKNQFDQEVGNGSDISLHLTVRLKGYPQPVLKIEIATQPAQYLGSVKSVDEASLSLLGKQDEYVFLTALLGGALGQPTVRPKLMEALLSMDAAKHALALLQWSGDRPTTDEEKAAYLIAAQDFSHLVPLGEAGVSVAEQHIDYILEHGMPYDVPGALIPVLGEMKDPRLCSVLLKLLECYSAPLGSDDAEQLDAADTLAVLGALGTSGDQKALTALDELASCKNSKVAVAAKRAAKQIRGEESGGIGSPRKR